MGAGIMQIIVEVLCMGVKGGVPLHILADAISKSMAGKAPPLTNWYPSTFKGQFAGTPTSFFL
jgi:hypothetical protein